MTGFIIDPYSSWDEWGLLLLVFTGLLLAYVTGYKKGIIFFNRKDKHESDVNIMSSIQSGVMSLLGIMLAFSFSVSSSRFEERRALVNQEATSIGTAYFRVGLLNDTITRNNLRNLLKQYLDARIRYYDQYRIRTTEQQQHALDEELINMRITLWAKSARIGKSHPNVNSSLIVQSLNNLIDVSDNISSALTNRAPVTILYILIFISIFTFFAKGYYHAHARIMRLKFSISLMLIICSIMMLIIDLDKPLTGLVNLDTTEMINLKNSLERYGDLNPSDEY